MADSPRSPLAESATPAEIAALAETVGAPAGDAALGPDAPPLARGATVGRYMVMRLLGEGGMGIVYDAYDPELDRRVALKLLRPRAEDAASISEGRARLVREAQAMARVAHPNVVAVHDVGTWAGRVFVAMERVDGETLRAWVARGGRLWRDVVATFLGAARGLAAAHAAGLVHRDFKPDNVLVGQDGRARVVDFGLAHAAEARVAHEPARADGATPAVGALDTPLTREGALVGTPRYMAPEQLAGERTDASCDQFAFCVSLYEALYGEPPFDGRDLVTLSSNVRSGRVRESRARGVPSWVRAVVLRGLAVQPRDRHASMAALIDALERDPAAERRRWAIGAAAIGAIVLVVGGEHAIDARRAPVCPSAEPRLGGAWDDARRTQIAAAFRATRKPFAEDALRGATRAMDDYAAAWVAMSGEACAATRVRGAQSSELLDLRMECLGEALAGMRALTDQLAIADAKAVESAVRAASSLPPLARCADARALRAPTRVPDDPAARAKIEMVRSELAVARAVERAGKPKDAVARAEQAVSEARAIGYAPLVAEALLAYGEVLVTASEAKKARDALDGAVLAAVAGRHESAETDAWIALVHAAVVDMRNEDGREAAKHARAALERGPDEDRLAQLLVEEGALARHEGKYDEARATLERALAVRSARLPEDHPDVAACLNELGNVAFDQGRADDALAYHRRALAIREKSFGDAHPQVASSLNNIGNSLNAKGDFAGAIAAYERSLAIKIAAFGEENPSIADTLANLALVYVGAGDQERALATSERALQIRERTLGPDHPDVIQALQNMIEALIQLKRYDEAIAKAKRELAIAQKAYGADHPFTAPALTQIGGALVDQGKAAEALPYLEKALRLVESYDGDPTQRAGTRQSMAVALKATHGDPRRARDLAAKARAGYAKEPEYNRAEIEALDREFPGLPR